MRNGEWANQTLNSLFLTAQALPRGKSWSLLSHLCLSSLNTKHYLSWAFLFSLTSSREEQIANNIGSQSPRRSPLKARKSKDLWPFFFLSTSLEGQLKQSYLYILTWYKLSLRKRKVVCVGLYPITEKYYLSSVFGSVSWHSAPVRPSFPPFLLLPPHSVPSFFPFFPVSDEVISMTAREWKLIRTLEAFGQVFVEQLSYALEDFHQPWLLSTKTTAPL